jgi:hypothetical protein
MISTIRFLPGNYNSYLVLSIGNHNPKIKSNQFDAVAFKYLVLKGYNLS